MRQQVGQDLLGSGQGGAHSGYEIAETDPVISVDQADHLSQGRGNGQRIGIAVVVADFVGQDPEHRGEFARVAGEVVEQCCGEAVGALFGSIASLRLLSTPKRCGPAPGR